MSSVTIIWTAAATVCLTLGTIQLFVWWQNRGKIERLFFFVMSWLTAWMDFDELAAMKATSPETFGAILRWNQVPVWLLFIAIALFMRVHLRAGRWMIAAIAIGIRGVTLVINFAIPPNLNFREITGLRTIGFLGDQVVLPVGTPSLVMVVAQFALLLILAYVIDAAVTVWRRGERRRALLTGGSFAFFVSLGTLQSSLSFWQVINIPPGAGIYFVGVIAIIAFDLSLEAKRAAALEVQLRDTQESKQKEVTHLGRVATFGELSVSLAHEINQPLGIILTNAQAAQRLLAKESPDLKEVKEILGDIVDENLRASEVIKRMRALLRRGEMCREEIDLNEVIRDVIHLTRNELRRREVTLDHSLTEGLPVVSADRVQLQQVLLNLILNACEAMAANDSRSRRLELVTTSDGCAVCLEVKDAGRGLPEEIEQVFLPFFTTKEHGLGMGLAICRSIVSSHRGQLWAEAGQGQGAIFHMVLPAKEVAA